MEYFTTRQTERGIKIGAVVGFLATAAGAVLWEARWWAQGGFFSYGFTIRLLLLLLIAGTAVGALFGGLAGALLDSLKDRSKR